MSKRIQYAQSLPVLSANPGSDTGRVVFYALSDGLYARQPNGTIVGPLSAATPAPANMVTTDSKQTVIGEKTFNAGTLKMSSPLASSVEPYSDANPPESLWLQQAAGVPPNPPNTISVLYTDTTGRVYVKNSTGAVIEITNQAGGGGTGGAADAKEAIIDFGAVPTTTQAFVIADASITATSQVLVQHGGQAVTGRSADENEMDPLLCRAAPGEGQMTVYATALDGPVKGAYPINYLVG